MKKLLLFVFIFIGFWVNAQELDEIYIRETLYLADSGVNKITSGDTLATKEYVDANGGAVSFGSQYQIPATNATTDDFNYDAGLRYYGDSLVVDNNSIVHGNIGIGITDPLSALHINNGFGSLATGIIMGSSNDDGIYMRTANIMSVELDGILRWDFQPTRLLGTGSFNAALMSLSPSATTPGFSFAADFDLGIGRFGADAGSGIAGAKEIFRWTENVTEQLGVNPQGDFTGTLANPSLYISEVGTGFYKPDADNFVFGINAVESMRLTEDSVLMDSSAHIGKDLFVDGNVGVGTSIPNELLHILSSTNSSVLEVQSTFIGGDARLNLYADNTGLSQLRFGDQDDVNIGLITYDHSDNSMALRTNNATSISIDSNGDVGINDVTPTFKLDVNGTGRFTGIVNFDVFPITPSSAPTTDYQVANKKYVDDIVGVMRVATAQLLYTNTTETTIITLPEDAVVWNVTTELLTTFDAGTTNLLEVGTTTDPDAFVADSQILIEVAPIWDEGASGSMPQRLDGAGDNITYTYTPSGTTPTAGVCTIYIRYSLP